MENLEKIGITVNIELIRGNYAIFEKTVGWQAEIRRSSGLGFGEIMTSRSQYDKMPPFRNKKGG